MRPVILSEKEVHRLRLQNSARKAAGIKLIKPEYKDCMRCEREFVSEGPHNRMCPHCRNYKENLN